MREGDEKEAGDERRRREGGRRGKVVLG